MKHDLRLAAAALAGWAAVSVWLVLPAWVALCCALLALVGVGVARRTAVVIPLVALVALGSTVGWRLAERDSSTLADAARDRSVVELPVRLTSDGRPAGHSCVVTARTDDGSLTAFVGDRLAERERLTAGSNWVLRMRLQMVDREVEATVLDARFVDSGAWWWRAAESVRGGVRSSSHGPADGRVLVPALVVGDDAQVSPQLAHDFRRSGLTHLMAVSGTNLTIVVAAVVGAAVAVGVRRRFRVWVGLVAVVGFVLVARPEPSVLRAAVMGTVALVAWGWGARGGIRSLCLAVLALLVIDPWLARSAGFVLSVCATAGIILFSRPLADRLWWVPRWAAFAVAVPLAAQVACTPALVALSGEVSIVAIAANLLAAPAVAPATVLGLLAGLLHVIALVGPALAWVPGGAAAWCASWIAAVGHWLGGQAAPGVAWPGPWLLVIPALPVAAWLGWRTIRHPPLVAGLAIGLAIAVVRPPQPGWPPDGWLMVACDVGQGDATVLSLDRPGEAVVIDTGPDDMAVHACLQRLRIERIRLFIVTHGDADHAAGWRGVARGRQVDQALIGVGGGRAPHGVPVHHAAAGESFALDRVAFRVLWPEADARVEATNDVGIVLSVTTHGVRLLLTADLGGEAERRVLRTGADLRADVLKFPHHGSGDQEPTFLAATGSQLATISVGADNDYGHPTDKALQWLRDLGIAAYRTDQLGDIAIVERNGRLGVVSRR